MSVGEANAFLGQLVLMRRRHLGLRIVATHITVAEIISENEEDVGFVSGKRWNAKYKESEKEGFHFHYKCESGIAVYS